MFYEPLVKKAKKQSLSENAYDQTTFPMIQHFPMFYCELKQLININFNNFTVITCVASIESVMFCH